MVALTLPHTMQLRLSFEHGAILDGLPGWREVFALPLPERMAALRDPGTRRRLDDGAQSDEAGILRHLAVWERLIIEETFAPENAALRGSHASGTSPGQRGVAAFDALLDVVVADELRTGLRPPIPESEADWELRAAGLAGPPGHRRRLRRRGPSRHHVRRHLLHLHAGRRGAGRAACSVGSRRCGC